MYAVVKTGGKQYRVASGQKIKIEPITADVGQEVSLPVLAIGSGDNLVVGNPTVPGAHVAATVVEHGKREKVRIFKLRRRKHSRTSQGHRQGYTEIQIGAIEPAGATGQATAPEQQQPDAVNQE